MKPKAKEKEKVKAQAAESAPADPDCLRPRTRRTLEDAIAWLEDVIWTAPADVTAHSPIAQEFTHEVIYNENGEPEKTRHRVKAVNKFPAMRLLCTLKGWHTQASKPVEQRDTLKEWVNALRAQNDEEERKESQRYQNLVEFADDGDDEEDEQDYDYEQDQEEQEQNESPREENPQETFRSVSVSKGVEKNPGAKNKAKADRVTSQERHVNVSKRRIGANPQTATQRGFTIVSPARRRRQASSIKAITGKLALDAKDKETRRKKKVPLAVRTKRKLRRKKNTAKLLNNKNQNQNESETDLVLNCIN